MNFNSWQYLLFFSVMFVLYYGITAKNRRYSNKFSQIVLLASSLFFYACWNPTYLALILLSVFVTWMSGLAMQDKTQNHKRLILLLSLAINLGILFFFKYYNFFAGTISRFTLFQLPTFNILLPVGISFYTFQALGYSIDVYQGTVNAERDFINYALFVTFFPQLVAGPIERTANLLPQFKVNHDFDYSKVTSGLKLAAWGMFKKVAIADRVAVLVNAVYDNTKDSPASALLLATFFFAIQIYCDFSGYSDIAIGSARALGFDLMHNFRSPYFARSVTDFWKRWHISLSTWLSNYIYIPLGGNRKGFGRQCLNILIVFTLSGLWHGAAWHFVAWGLLHGAFQIVQRCWNKLFPKKKQENAIVALFQMFITFTFVCMAWVFFRSKSVSEAIVVLQKIVNLPLEFLGYAAVHSKNGIVSAILEKFLLDRGVMANLLAEFKVTFGLAEIGLSFVLIIVLIITETLTSKTDGVTLVMKAPLAVRWVGYYVLLTVILFSWHQASVQFIYFTF
jgi:D-alanyl-lipoteichoic acid acyltransferase DltB (MBOAT superfamily)